MFPKMKVSYEKPITSINEETTLRKENIIMREISFPNIFLTNWYIWEALSCSLESHPIIFSSIIKKIHNHKGHDVLIQIKRHWKNKGNRHLSQNDWESKSKQSSKMKILMTILKISKSFDQNHNYSYIPRDWHS